MQTSVVTETADKIEAKLRHALLKRGCGEECVSHHYVGDGQQFLRLPLHNADVIFNECFVSHIQRGVPYCLMGTQYHAFVVGNIQQADAHDFKSVLHSPCTSRPKPSDMRSLLPGLADVARVYGNGKQAVHIQYTPCKGLVQQKPIDAALLPSVEVLTIGLLSMFAIASHLGEVYLSR